MANAYSFFVKIDDDKKTIHSNLLFYHLPIFLCVFFSFVAKLNCCEWLFVLVILFVSLIIYPINFNLRNSGYIKNLYDNQVKDRRIARVSIALYAVLLDTMHIICALITTSLFLTLIIYIEEKSINDDINNFRNAIEYALFALDVKGNQQIILYSDISKFISILFWALGQVPLAILISVWLNSFQYALVSFEQNNNKVK